MKINLVTLCSGIEAQGQAMRQLCADYPELEWDLLAWSEINKDAIRAHDAIFPEYAARNLGDMTTCDYSNITEPVDVLFYSTPCQSVSVAGQNKGMKEGTDAASALIWHTRRAIETLRPKICILENVKGMIMGNNLREFHKWQDVMTNYGYTNFAKVLNSRDFGVPQHRERIFMLSILGGQSYHFPEPFKLEKRIKDILEPYGTVDESFYFKPEQLLRIIEHCDRKTDEGCGFKTQFKTEDEISGCVTSRYGQRETDPCLKEGISIHPLNRKMEFNGFKDIKSDTAPCLTAHDGRGGEPCLWQRLSLYGNNAQAGRIYDEDGIPPCLDTCCGGNRMPKILTSVRTEEAKRLRREKGIEIFANRQLVPREDGISNTITTVSHDNCLIEPVIKRTAPIQIGAKYGRLTVVEKTDKRQGTNFIYKCKCDCGNECYVNSGRLGISTFSCGCLRATKNVTHGESKTRLYNIWCLMRRRCANENTPQYKNYGGRGIKVCDEWDNFTSFRDWALSNGYSDELTLDRIDVNGNYEPSNCRWIPASEQPLNRTVWGEIPYEGIVTDATGYRAQITVNGKKIYIAHSVDDIEYLVNARNEYIKAHNLPHKIQVYAKQDPAIIQRPHGFNDGGLFEEIAPTITTSSWDNNNLLKEPQMMQKVGDRGTSNFSKKDISFCIPANPMSDRGQMLLEPQTEEPMVFTFDNIPDKTVLKDEDGKGYLWQDGGLWRVRKLCPIECGRLMGCSDADIQKMIDAGISKTALYTLFGNSIVTDVLYHIFRKLWIDTSCESAQKSLFDF